MTQPVSTIGSRMALQRGESQAQGPAPSHRLAALALGQAQRSAQVRRLQAHAHTPDMNLRDIQLPRMDWAACSHVVNV